MAADLLILFKARLSAMVLVTTAVGFLLAAPAGASWWLLPAVLAGTGLASFGAAGLNQWRERALDARMERTRGRPLPAGRLAPRAALTASLVVATVGPASLWAVAGVVPAALAATTVLLYVLVYTPLKRVSSLNTAVGAVCGALPPVIGWTAAGGALDVGAGLLFALLFLWQMPHFFALAWLHRRDYARGGFAMLPVMDPRGRVTFPVTVFFALLLLPLGLIVTLAGLAGPWFALGSVGLGTWWTLLSLRLARSGDDRDARRVFLASLAYLPLVLGLMVADRGPRAGDPSVGQAIAAEAER